MFTKRIKKSRIKEIDFIRGVLICFMMVDHLFFDFWGILPDYFSPFEINLYNFGVWYWTWLIRIITRFIILSLFFLISGISTSFSRNVIRRGIITFLFGVAIGLGFLAVGKIMNDPYCYVFFGAITCFGVSILIYGLFKLLFNKLCPKHLDDFKWFCLALGLVFIAIGLIFDCWNVTNNGSERVYEINASNFFYIIIGRFQDSNAQDWLPLFPYMGFLFIGAFIGSMVYKNQTSIFTKTPIAKLDEPNLKDTHPYLLPVKWFRNSICFVGRYSIWFYLGHQLLFIPLLGVIMLATGHQIINIW